MLSGVERLAVAAHADRLDHPAMRAGVPVIGRRVATPAYAHAPGYDLAGQLGTEVLGTVRARAGVEAPGAATGLAQ